MSTAAYTYDFLVAYIIRNVCISRFIQYSYAVIANELHYNTIYELFNCF